MLTANHANISTALRLDLPPAAYSTSQVPKKMNQKLIDILCNMASKTTDDICVTLNPVTKNWDLRNVIKEGEVRSHVVDRSDLKASITSAVSELSPLLPAEIDC